MEIFQGYPEPRAPAEENPQRNAPADGLGDDIAQGGATDTERGEYSDAEDQERAKNHMEDSVGKIYFHRGPRITRCVHDALGHRYGAHSNHADELDAHICRPLLDYVRGYAQNGKYLIGKEDADYRHGYRIGNGDNEGLLRCTIGGLFIASPYRAGAYRAGALEKAHHQGIHYGDGDAGNADPGD